MRNSQVIVKGADNPVIILFDFDGPFAVNGLRNFTDVRVTLFDEVYSTVVTPAQCFIVGTSELRLRVGMVTNVKPALHDLHIVGYNAVYQHGIVFNSKCHRNLTPVKVCG
ncbi:hypothetical protein [Teredinibacter turnerae]|uniref:hypothetical protein n=1 Tax=Teredinibacter turnerae TaxID=2426 RepID=UPI00049132F8